MPPDRPTSKSSENRRSNKPIMEKKRRARINNCLSELKNLLLEAMRKDPARHSKLEKADILELTVKHLRNLQRHQTTLTVRADPEVITKYREGFHKCAVEVSRYVDSLDGIDVPIKHRLLNHLANCITGLGMFVMPPSVAPLMASNGVARNLAAVFHGRTLGHHSVTPPRTPQLTTATTGDSLMASNDVRFHQMALSRRMTPSGELTLVMPPVHSNHSRSGSAGRKRPPSGDVNATWMSPKRSPDSTTSVDDTVTSQSCPDAGTTDLTTSCQVLSDSPRLRSPDGSHTTWTSVPTTTTTTGSGTPEVVSYSGNAYVKLFPEGLVPRTSTHSTTGSGPDLCCSQCVGVSTDHHHVAPDDILEPVNLSKDADKMWRPW